MKSKKPFFSRELIYNNMKRFWWIAVLYTLALFLVSPLITLTNGSDVIPKIGYNIDFSDIFGGTIIFLLTVPVFVGVMAFRYMQNSKSMVTIHAMPYTRLRLYVNNIISGLILLLVPILLNSAFLSVIQLGNLGGTYFKEGIVLRYLGVSVLTSVSLYIWTVFVGMFTGSSIAQIIFTYILNFLFAGIVLVCQYLLSGLLYGFVVNEEICLEFLKISPIAQIMFFTDSKPDTGFFIIADIIICTIALVAGYFVYKYRNLETAGDVVSGKYIKPLFKYGVTTCVMLVGAVYVREIFSMDSVNIFIYLLFALIGYVIAEMLIRKSFKIWDSYKGFLIFSIAFAIIGFGVKADLFGYEKYIPDIDGIKSAALNVSANFSDSTPSDPGDGILYNKDNIKNIIKLHKEIVEDKNINLTEENYTDSIGVSYELIDGRVIKRSYTFEYGKYTDLINEIYDSEEYKKSINDIFDYTEKDIYSIRISNDLFRNKFVTIDNEREISELLNAMKLDIINMTTEEREEYTNLYRIEVTAKEIKPSKIENTVAVTKEYYIEDSKDMAFFSKRFNINAENINSFVTQRGYDKILLNTDDVISITLRDNLYKGVVVLTDKNKINEVMNILTKLPTINYHKNYNYDNIISVEIDLANGDDAWREFDKTENKELVSLFN